MARSKVESKSKYGFDVFPREWFSIRDYACHHGISKTTARNILLVKAEKGELVMDRQPNPKGLPTLIFMQTLFFSEVYHGVREVFQRDYLVSKYDRYVPIKPNAGKLF